MSKTPIEQLKIGTVLEFHTLAGDIWPMVYVAARETQVSTTLYFAHTGLRAVRRWAGYRASNPETLQRRFPQLKEYDWGNHIYTFT